MALSERSRGYEGVAFSPDGRTVLPPRGLDRVGRAEERDFLTRRKGGRAVGNLVRIGTKYAGHGDPVSRGVDPEDGLTFEQWVVNPEGIGGANEWVVRDATGKIIEQESGEKIYFD